MSTIETTEKRSTFMRPNPVLNAKIKWDEWTREEGIATYNGIFAKTGIFMGMTILGYILYFLLAKVIFRHLTPIVSGPTGVGISLPQVILLPVLLIAGIVIAVKACRKPEKTPVLGSIYAAIQGYFIANTVQTAVDINGFGPIVEIIAVLALLVTILIVMTMAFLYAKGWVKAGKRFNTVMKTAFPAMIVFSVLSVILSLIPPTRQIMAAFISANPLLPIIFSFIGIIIASLFLISDFDRIQQTVEGNAPKMYEWTAAFGLATTVIWIYIKILQLALRILAKSKRN